LEFLGDDDHRTYDDTRPRQLSTLGSQFIAGFCITPFLPAICAVTAPSVPSFNIACV